VRPPPDILGVSLYDADIEGLWHRCFNCYSKVWPGVWYDHHIEGCCDWSNDHIKCCRDWSNDHMKVILCSGTAASTVTPKYSQVFGVITILSDVVIG